MADATNMLQRAKTAFALERYKDCLRMVLPLLSDVNGDESRAAYSLAIKSYYNLDNSRRARDLAEKAIGLFPEDVDFRALRGAILLRLGLHALALADFDHVLSRQPLDAAVHYLKASSHLARVELVQAKSAIDKALELEPQDADYHVLLASILYPMEREQEMREALDTALALDPENHKALYLKGVVEAKRNAKLSLLRRALFLNPRDKDYQKEYSHSRWYGPVCLVLMGIVLAVMAAYKYAPVVSQASAWAEAPLFLLAYIVALVAAPKRWLTFFFFAAMISLVALEPETLHEPTQVAVTGSAILFLAWVFSAFSYGLHAIFIGVYSVLERFFTQMICAYRAGEFRRWMSETFNSRSSMLTLCGMLFSIPVLLAHPLSMPFLALVSLAGPLSWLIIQRGRAVGNWLFCVFFFTLSFSPASAWGTSCP